MYGQFFPTGDGVHEQQVDLVGAESVAGVDLAQGPREFGDQGQTGVQVEGGHGYGRWKGSFLYINIKDGRIKFMCYIAMVRVRSIWNHGD